jgi:hypothetical protein
MVVAMLSHRHHGRKASFAPTKRSRTATQNLTVAIYQVRRFKGREQSASTARCSPKKYAS